MSWIAPQGGTRQKQPKEPDAKHLDFIRALPCIISGAQAEPAHVRFGDPKAGKRSTGMQERLDEWTVPLSPHWHRTGPDAQHNMNEREFWKSHDINVLAVCAALYECSGDIEAGEDIIRRARADEFPWKE